MTKTIATAAALVLLAALVFSWFDANGAALEKCMETHSEEVCRHTLR